MIASLRGVSKKLAADRAGPSVTRASPGRSGRTAGAEWRRQDHRRAPPAGLEPGDLGRGAHLRRKPEIEPQPAAGPMLQVGRMPETLRVREHLQLFSSYYANPRPLEELLAVAGLEGLEDKLFGTLSGGKSSACSSLSLSAGILTLSVSMNRHSAWMSRPGERCGSRSQTGQRKTILLTTHYLEEADALASRIVVIQKGKVIAEGTPQQLKTADGSRSIRCTTSLQASFRFRLTGSDQRGAGWRRDAGAHPGA